MPAGTRNIRAVRNCWGGAVWILCSGPPVARHFSTFQKPDPLFTPPWNSSSFPPSLSPASEIISFLPFSCSRPSSKTSSGTAEHLRRHNEATLADGLGEVFRTERTEHLKYHRGLRDGKFPPPLRGFEEGTCQFLITGLEQTTSPPPCTGASQRKSCFWFPIKDLLTFFICNVAWCSGMFVDRLLCSAWADISSSETMNASVKPHIHMTSYSRDAINMLTLAASPEQFFHKTKALLLKISASEIVICGCLLWHYKQSLKTNPVTCWLRPFYNTTYLLGFNLLLSYFKISDL